LESNNENINGLNEPYLAFRKLLVSSELSFCNSFPKQFLSTEMILHEELAVSQIEKTVVKIT